MRKALRRIRRRFGIAAPRLAVNPHVPWYWRALRIVAVLSVSGVLALWMYDAGRRFAGFDASEVQDELAMLRKRVAEFEADVPRLRAVADSSDARLKIEQAAERDLARQVKQLEADNARLKEDIAYFENLSARDQADERVRIARFKVEPGALPGEYHFRVLVMQGGSRPRGFDGRLQFIVNLQRDGKDAILVIPDELPDPGAAYQIRFTRFYRAEGVFRADPAAKVRSVQVRLLEKGTEQPRATESFTLS
ncbi:MAG: hypothetical protein IT515_11305 [Burkholderiales bacterium]|nr:hypothetical protein [Burkholderiales bacterium]